MLAELLMTQRKMLAEINNNIIVYDQEQILAQIHHCIEELIEVRRELPMRKNWGTKQYKSPNWKLVKEEAIDALHFMLNIFILLDMNSEDIMYEYYIKDVVNKERIKEWKEAANELF